jgi:putative ATP-binding cassette transporter
MQLFRNIQKLFAYLLRYSRQVPHARALGVVILVAGVMSGLANTVLIGVVNHVINADGAGSATLLWLFAAVCVLLPVARYAADFFLTYLSEKATLHLRMTMSRRILEAPLRQLEEVGTSRLMTALTADIPSVIGAMTILPVLCMNIAVVGGSLVYMGILSWQILLAVLLFLAIGMAAYQLPLMKAQTHIQVLRERGEELFERFKGVTEGVKELKLHHERRRAYLEEQLEPTATELAGHSVSAQRLFASAVSWGQVMVFILVGLIAFALPSTLQQDKAVLTGFTLAILYMVNPIQAIMNAMPQLSRATASMRRVEELKLSLEAVSATPQTAHASWSDWSTLELSGATHTYHSERDQANFTVGPVDLRFERGEIVFITGGNGSGKTTFAKLLTGLYAPEAGEIRVDGEPVTAATLGQYNALFSVVFSDFYLFDAFLGLGRHELDAQARHYLEELHLDHKVRVENGRLSTTQLSQGQRKRLALLTAYLEDRSIYLFDEWAADQDPQFKEVFYYKLLPQLKERGKTVFAISHDDRYYHVADRVIKLDYGQVAEDVRGELLELAPTGAGRGG